MTFQIFKSPHTLVELLIYKQIGIKSEVNPKLQICWVIYRVLQSGVDVMGVLGEYLNVFAWTQSGWKLWGSRRVWFGRCSSIPDPRVYR